MFEVVHDVLCLAVCERCIVWVCRELSFASDGFSVFFGGV